MILSDITKNKPIFNQYNIFDKYKYFFCQSVFWSPLNHRKKGRSNQQQCNAACAVARLVFLFCCALITSRCNAFQQFFKYQKESQFYGPYLQIVVFLVTMYILNNFWHWNSKCKTRWFSKFGIFSFSWKLIQVNLFSYW